MSIDARVCLIPKLLVTTPPSELQAFALILMVC